MDVGRDQLHASLRGHPAIDSREATDARTLRRATWREAPSLITFDVSFIPLRLVLAPVLALAAPSARAVALIKPQFEAGRSELKKGIVRAPETRAAVCEAVAAGFASSAGACWAPFRPPSRVATATCEFLIAAENARR